MLEQYLDDKGYLRYEENDKLVHRAVAYEEIYLKNPEEYPLGFACYVVHHIDMNKLNNDTSNLQILTPEEHSWIHKRPSLAELLDEFYSDPDFDSNDFYYTGV